MSSAALIEERGCAWATRPWEEPGKEAEGQFDGDLYDLKTATMFPTPSRASVNELALCSFLPKSFIITFEFYFQTRSHTHITFHITSNKA